MLKRTLRVRTVFNGERPQRCVRRLVPLLVLLFLMPSLSGCIGGPSVSWGSSNGEYSTSMDSGSSTDIGTQSISVTNKLASSSSRHLVDDSIELNGCENSTVTISGWLVQTKVFDEPQTTTHAITSWMIYAMPYEQAQDVEPGSIFVSIVNAEDDWPSPTQAEGIPLVDGILSDGKASDFPTRKWTLLAIIPANENVFEATLQMDTNQAVQLNGYLRQGESINEDQMTDCRVDAASKGWTGHFVVTSINYGGNRVVDVNEAYIGGDIPFFGRGLYTTMLLVSIVASGALYIFSRNQIILGADSQAQSMLSEQQMRAGKSARHEAARHEARMAATTKAKEAEYTGKPTKKSAGVPKFDIGAALAEESPGTSTGHYVAGSSVTATDEADAMEDMISDMQEEQAFEQELKDKGLRNVIGNMPKSGGGRRNIATQAHSSRVSRVQPEPEPEPTPKSKPTRRTKKTQTPETDPVTQEEEAPSRRVDPEVNDEGDFSDFSL